MSPGVAAIALLLASVLADVVSAGEEPSIDLRIAAGTEWDSNAERAVASEVQFLRGASLSGQVGGDALVRVLLDASAQIPVASGHGIDLGYVLGAKRFFSRQSEDLVVHELSFSSAHPVVGPVLATSFATWRQSRIRSGLRDYSLAAAGGGLSASLANRVTFGARAGWTAFDFPPEPRLEYSGPSVGGEVSLRPWNHVALMGFVDHGWRAYEGPAIVEALVADDDGGSRTVYTYCDGTDVVPPACAPRDRDDTELTIGGRATYRGTFIAGVEALGRFQRSTSALEEIDRYRLSAHATVGLPFRLVLNVMGAAQFNTGLSVTQTKYLAEDDENQNHLELQVGRKLGGGIAAELRWSLFANEFATADAHFLRQTFYAGLSYRVSDEE